MLVPILELDEDPDNARIHPDDNLEAIRLSYQTFGQVKPVVGWWRNTVEGGGRLMVIAGNGSLRSAIALGWTHLAVSVFEGSLYDARAFALADNRAPELARWDTKKVDAQMRQISAHWSERAAAVPTWEPAKVEWSPALVGFSEVKVVPAAGPPPPEPEPPARPATERRAPELREATISINGVRLDTDQALYFRAAVENGIHELADPDYFASVGEVAPKYLAGLREIRRLIGVTAGPLEGTA